MKISFSTLGCPQWSWDDMIVTAKDVGFDGIEVRGIENELHVPRAKPFLRTNIDKTKQRLSRMALEIPCLTSSCYLFDKVNIDAYMQEGKDYIDLAQRLGSPFVRVLGDANPEPSEDIDFDFVAQRVGELANYASGRDVKVLIETNGCFANSGKILELIKKVKSPSAGILWDIHHPYRYMNEQVGYTYEMLKDYICFVHIKDSIMSDSKVKYKMMGYGDVPVKDALLTLKENGYTGFVSLEWVKRWCMDLEDAGVVFSHYVNFVRDSIK